MGDITKPHILKVVHVGSKVTDMARTLMGEMVDLKVVKF